MISLERARRFLSEKGSRLALAVVPLAAVAISAIPAHASVIFNVGSGSGNGNCGGTPAASRELLQLSAERHWRRYLRELSSYGGNGQLDFSIGRNHLSRCQFRWRERFSQPWHNSRRVELQPGSSSAGPHGDAFRSIERGGLWQRQHLDYLGKRSQANSSTAYLTTRFTISVRTSCSVSAVFPETSAVMSAPGGRASASYLLCAMKAT